MAEEINEESVNLEVLFAALIIANGGPVRIPVDVFDTLPDNLVLTLDVDESAAQIVLSVISQEQLDAIK